MLTARFYPDAGLNVRFRSPESLDMDCTHHLPDCDLDEISIKYYDREQEN